jgi:hypothetical protein
VNEHENDKDEHDVDPEEHPEQAAALGKGGEKEAHTEEGTDDERIDTGEHSDAPGPFGTG